MRKLLLSVVLGAATAGAASTHVCGPAPVVRAELQKATATFAVDPQAFDQNVKPFRTLRRRYPNDLFVHERYQDAVRQYGVEGHLRALTAEYQALQSEHPDDLVYRYLYFRSLIGRNTPAAVQGLSEILTEHPDFAPADRMLAEIHASPTFRDSRKQEAEEQTFRQLCPGETLARLPDAIPDPSPLVAQAEKLFAQGGDPAQAITLAQQGVREDEWRLQRIRPVDWYSLDFKRQAQFALQTEYWRLWTLQVRCQRKAGETGKANALLATMEQRVTLLPKSQAPQHWEALAYLARLYAEGNQTRQASQKLDQMQQLLASFPDPGHAAELQDLRKLIPAQSGNSDR